MNARSGWLRLRLRVVLAGMAAMLWAGGYVGYRLYMAFCPMPMGAGPAGPAVPEEPFTEVWTEGRVLLVGMGDSITRGLGASKPHQYFALLQANDDAQYPDMAGRDLRRVLPNLEAVNYALDYTTSAQHVARQLPRLAVQPEDVRGIVVLTSGGNDLIHDYGRSAPVDGAMYGCTVRQAKVWTENLKERLIVLVEGINARFPGGCDIFLANVYDPTDGVGDPQIRGLPRWRACVEVLRLANEKIAEVCAAYDNVHLVDIHSEFLGHGFHCREWWRRNYRPADPHHWYFHNIEDPNPRGYDAIRRLYLQEMVQRLALREDGRTASADSIVE
ncbi:MAG: SGNH/GDSL hydrolase family protein [Phycisphaerae bacterium]|nr:SGNH/GDSL hydrolase family protein [Phycisphaerae bacterium]